MERLMSLLVSCRSDFLSPVALTPTFLSTTTIYSVTVPPVSSSCPSVYIRSKCLNTECGMEINAVPLFVGPSSITFGPFSNLPGTVVYTVYTLHEDGTTDVLKKTFNIYFFFFFFILIFFFSLFFSPERTRSVSRSPSTLSAFQTSPFPPLAACSRPFHRPRHRTSMP